MSGEYDARMRVLIRRVAEHLKVPTEILDLYEVSVVRFLTEEIRELTEYVSISIFALLIFF